MAYADTSTSTLALASQSAFGTVASSGFQYVRFTSESLTFAAETTASEEITSTRGVSDVIRTAGSATGDIEFELSHDAVTDLILEGALQDTSWSGSDVLQNGQVQQYFSIEKKFVGTGNEYFFMEDAAVSALEVNVEQGAIVTATASFIGSTLNTGTGTSGAGTISAAGTSPVISGVSDNLTIKLGTSGSEATVTNVQSCSFSIDNGLREQRRIGSANLAGVGSGRFNVTGSLVMYFEDDAEYALFMDETVRGLELGLYDSATAYKGYKFWFPKIKYTTAEVLATGVDSDIIVSFEWQALEDSSNGTLQVTRDDTA